MVKNDASGKLTGRKPGKLIQIVRNPNSNGKATGDYRPAYLDAITIEEGNDDLTVASRRALRGSAPGLLRLRFAAGAGAQGSGQRSSRTRSTSCPPAARGTSH